MKEILSCGRELSRLKRAHAGLPPAGLALVAGCAFLTLVGCSSTDEPGTYAAATCNETCEKSVALGCPNDTMTVGECVAQCEAQIAGCENDTIVDNYLGCVAATTMVCGETTGTASSPECVSEGLVYFACLEGVDLTDAGGGSDAGDSGGGADPTDTGGGADVPTGGSATVPPTPTVAAGEIAFTVRDGEDTHGPVTCSVGAGAQIGYNAVPEGTFPGFAGALMLGCSDGADASNRTAVQLSALLPSLAPGSYRIATFDESGSLTQNSVMAMVVVDGQGGTLPATANGGITYEGTLTLTAASEGGRVAGSFTATWPRSSRIVDGVSRNIEDVPGAMSIAFDGTVN